MRAELTVVTGPPCSGKTTHVQAERQPGDLVVDLDALAAALGYPADHITWDDPHPAVTAARIARARILDALLAGKVGGPAWVIDTAPTDRALLAYLNAGAQLVELDPGIGVCLERAAARPDGTADRVRAWYGRHAKGGALDVFE